MKAVLIHETSHVIQAYKSAQSWAAEGIANVVVLKLFPEHVQQLGVCTATTALDKAGYGCWARFLNKAQNASSCKTDFVGKLSVCYRGATCDDNAVFQQCGLTSVQEAWKTYGPSSQ